MTTEALLAGIVVGFLYYELVGISPGGVVAPGYLALFVRQPQRIAVTIVLALLVWVVLDRLSRRLIVYGRRRLLLALLLGFCAKLALEHWIRPNVSVGLDLESIGYLIPGLIANEMARQKVVPTLASLGIVTVAAYCIVSLIV